MLRPVLFGFLLAALSTPAKGIPAEGLPFLQDDYPGALAAARSKKLPIFAEAWAPW